MSGLNIVLWFVGFVLLTFGIVRAQGPWSRYRALQVTDANIRRYEQWRGGCNREGEDVTGADVMRDELRRQLRLWLAVALVGLILVVAGFVAT